MRVKIKRKMTTDEFISFFMSTCIVFLCIYLGIVVLTAIDWFVTFLVVTMLFYSKTVFDYINIVSKSIFRFDATEVFEVR